MTDTTPEEVMLSLTVIEADGVETESVSVNSITIYACKLAQLDSVKLIAHSFSILQLSATHSL